MLGVLQPQNATGLFKFQVSTASVGKANRKATQDNEKRATILHLTIWLIQVCVNHSICSLLCLNFAPALIIAQIRVQHFLNG